MRIERAEWYPQAKCNPINPKSVGKPDFFSENEQDVQEAKNFCYGCPTKNPCLDKALEKREPVGVWGGATEKERKSIIRRRQRIARTSPTQ